METMEFRNLFHTVLASFHILNTCQKLQWMVDIIAKTQITDHFDNCYTLRSLGAILSEYLYFSTSRIWQGWGELMKYNLNSGSSRMSTDRDREIEFLQATLNFFTTFKLANFRFNEDKGILESVKRKTKFPLSLLMMALHLTNISVSVWSMRTSTTQDRVLKLIQILTSVGATSVRCTLVKYDSEIICLVNNIFKLNPLIGLYLTLSWKEADTVILTSYSSGAWQRQDVFKKRCEWNSFQAVRHGNRIRHDLLHFCNLAKFRNPVPLFHDLVGYSPPCYLHCLLWHVPLPWYNHLHFCIHPVNVCIHGLAQKMLVSVSTLAGTWMRLGL